MEFLCARESLEVRDGDYENLKSLLGSSGARRPHQGKVGRPPRSESCVAFG